MVWGLVWAFINNISLTNQISSYNCKHVVFISQQICVPHLFTSEMPKNKGGGSGGAKGGSKAKGAEGGDAQPKQSKGGTAVKVIKSLICNFVPVSAQ